MAAPEFNCLVIEDTVVDRMIMKSVLTKLGRSCDVTFALSLADARVKLSERSYAIIFLDNALPDGNGADFVLELAAHKIWKNTPVVMVTDFPSPFMYAKAKAQNVVAIWTKEQFDWAAVNALFAKYVGGARRGA
ncbi:response regulator [Puniceibacterium sediminis]|nr:response regulator [Puniceibacterium sediminis]